MLARAPLAIFPALAPTRYRPHPLHDSARDWPETNCYVDVWIEILHALGCEPTAALGFTAAQDFEGDHFTFSKFPIEDLFELFGLEVGELALYDTPETHVVEQLSRGRLVLLEVDGFYLPDLRATSYRHEHTKTTVAINRVDPAAREMDYFHNGGLFALGGADYDAILRAESPIFPYAEFVKFERRRPPDPGAVPRILRRHVARRPVHNPVAAFRDRVRDQVETVANRPAAFLHKYAFNTARQLGMNFELLGSHLHWLENVGSGGTSLRRSAEACATLSSGAKIFQFQLARAAARRRFGGFEAFVDPLVDHYDRVFAELPNL